MELNPQHPVTSAVHDQWHKIVAILLHKYDLGHVIITMKDFEAFVADHPDSVVVLHDKRDGLHLTMTSREEGERLARTQGGLPS